MIGLVNLISVLFRCRELYTSTFEYFDNILLGKDARITYSHRLQKLNNLRGYLDSASRRLSLLLLHEHEESLL